jgi:hypothetical protein
MQTQQLLRLPTKNAKGKKLGEEEEEDKRFNVVLHNVVLP